MKEATTYDVIVIGAGLAGISAALRAKHKGYSVLVVEENERVGGKLECISAEGFRFDTGPSLFTEPNLVDELFELFGKNPRAYFEYVQYDEGCAYHFPNGEKIQFSDTQSIGLTKVDALEIKTYLEKSLRDYSTLGKVFLEGPAIKPLQFLHPKYFPYYGFFTSTQMRSSLSAYNAKNFSSPKIEQIFNRFGTYNGSSPFKMSGLFSMIPSLELKLGTYFPKLGMRSIVDALYQLAQEVGIEFRFGVEDLKAVQTQNGYSLQADFSLSCTQLICAIDHLTFYEKVLQNKTLFEKYKRAPRSSSGLVFYFGTTKKIEGLGLHTILFREQYKEEFEGIFEQKKTVDDPTVYIHNSSVVCPDDAPENGQALFCMINIPAQEALTPERREHYRNYILERIKNDLGTDLSANIQFEDYQDNYRIEQRTGSYQGALYGANSNSLRAVMKRHPNRIKNYKNLYFCGGTVHPGGGIPLVLRSSKIIGDLL